MLHKRKHKVSSFRILFVSLCLCSDLFSQTFMALLLLNNLPACKSMWSIIDTQKIQVFFQVYFFLIMFYMSRFESSFAQARTSFSLTLSETQLLVFYAKSTIFSLVAINSTIVTPLDYVHRDQNS